MSPRPDTLAARIVAARHSKGLTASALAREVGVTPTCVWNWEEGNTNPRAENLKALARALHVPASYLTHGTGPDETVFVLEATPYAPGQPDLAGVIVAAKSSIAKAAGIAVDKVRVTLDY